MLRGSLGKRKKRKREVGIAKARMQRGRKSRKAERPIGQAKEPGTRRARMRKGGTRMGERERVDAKAGTRGCRISWKADRLATPNKNEGTKNAGTSKRNAKAGTQK